MKKKIQNTMDKFAGLYAFLSLWVPGMWMAVVANQTDNSLLMALAVGCAFLAIYVAVNYKRILT